MNRKQRREQKVQMEKKQELKRAMKQENHQRETEEVVLTPETVKQLPKKQAEVMLLHYGNHVEVKENAKILNVPEGTVKSRLYYGRKKLKEILTAEK